MCPSPLPENHHALESGEEDEEMVVTDLLSPEKIIEVQEDDAPTQEDNRANEAGIENFLASVAEHSTELLHDNGDVLSKNDYEMELNGSPFKVIGEPYGGEYKGRGIWGSLLSHLSFPGLPTLLQPQLLACVPSWRYFCPSLCASSCQVSSQ